MAEYIIQEESLVAISSALRSKFSHLSVDTILALASARDEVTIFKFPSDIT